MDDMVDKKTWQEFSLAHVGVVDKMLWHTISRSHFCTLLAIFTRCYFYKFMVQFK